MKQLNFRHFNTTSEKFTVTVIFFQNWNKNGSKQANIILFSISRGCLPFCDNSRLFQKISEDYQGCPKIAEDV